MTELKGSINDHGSDKIQYVFSHDIIKLSNDTIFLNSKNRFIRWIFQLNYLIYKQLLLPLKLNDFFGAPNKKIAESIS